MRSDKQNYIYFLQAGDDGPIKIGRSVNVRKRFEQLRGGYPGELKLLATIEADLALEAELHQRFAAFRLNGEWFSSRVPLKSFIADVGKRSAEMPMQSVRQRLLKRQDYSGPATVDEVVAATFRNLASPESRRGYAKDWQMYCAWLATQNIEVLKVRPSIVRAYVAHRYEQGLARSSVARNLSVIRELYKALVAEELMEVNPAREIKNPGHDRAKRTPWYDEEVLARFFAWRGDGSWRDRRDRVCILLLAGIGWRRAEIARMRVEDLKGGMVTGIVKRGKSGSASVPSWLTSEIADWCHHAGISQGALLPRSPEDADHPHACPPGGCPRDGCNSHAVSGGMVYEIVQRVRIAVGIPDGQATPHAFRRTLATLARQRGVSLDDIQQQLIHAHAATTEGYLKGSRTMERAPGEWMGELVKNKPNRS